MDFDAILNYLVKNLMEFIILLTTISTSIILAFRVEKVKNTYNESLELLRGKLSYLVTFNQEHSKEARRALLEFYDLLRKCSDESKRVLEFVPDRNHYSEILQYKELINELVNEVDYKLYRLEILIDDEKIIALGFHCQTTIVLMSYWVEDYCGALSKLYEGENPAEKKIITFPEKSFSKINTENGEHIRTSLESLDLNISQMKKLIKAHFAELQKG